MEQHVRDLGSAELWHTSLERSRKRRVLAHDGRRRMARKKQASGAVTAAMLLTPVLQVAGASAGKKSGKQEVEQASPANRAVENRTLDVTLVEGATGARVAQVQQLLGVNADGIFGPQTAEAVRAFQARAGLAVDGVVGGATWRALFGSTGTRGTADSVVEGKGYQVTVQRASKQEAQILGDVPERGAVAKITLTRGQAEAATKPAVASKTEVRSRSNDSSDSRGGDRSSNSGGRSEIVKEPRGDSSPEAAPETEPAVDTGTPAVRGRCGSGRLVNPVKGTRTSNYGPRGGRNHDGVDIAAPTGTPVRAAACGVITTMGVQSGYGNIVCVDHGGGFTTCYAHLSGFKGRKGQRVHAGDVIGYVGSTGRSTGPHLHFETRVNGQARNPDPYLRGQRHPGTRHAKTQTADSGQTSTARGGREWDDTTRPSKASSNGGASYDDGTTQSWGSGEDAEWQSDDKQTTSTQGRQQAPAQQQAAPAPAQPQAAPAPAPAQPQAAPAPAPAAQPAPVQQAAPAPVEQAAPAPAPVEQPAPAPETPAPVEQAAPETPAPVEQPAPQPEAPAAETPAPAEQAAPEVEQPAPAPEAPAPVEQAAPEAPAAETPAPAEQAAPEAPAEAPAAPAAAAAGATG